jgi:hypothetical protein
MFLLKSSSLTVEVLDPLKDRDKLGSRYCTAGYIWQVIDSEKGPLLAGPCYPGPTNGFDGQGLPEVFEIALGQNATPVGCDLTVIGVGKVKRTSEVKPFHVRDNLAVSQFADWEEAGDGDSHLFRTIQTQGLQKLQISRRISLQNRSLFSTTEVQNLAASPLPIRWFAHPFFPWAKEQIWRPSLECRLPVNDHWQQDGEGWIGRQPGANAADGGYLPLVLPFGYPLSIEQKHPLIGSVTIECDFPLAWLPIWGNQNTASCEPYFHTVIEPGSLSTWTIAYHF